ncbi:MAG: hypothetical protein E7672_09195 [Ruminococcaceae bacterium]|nr:hypothetical protein [Oscillospiraceae bacterium]
MNIAKPTEKQLQWYDCELGVIIHYCMEIYNPDFKGHKTKEVRTELSPDKFNPTKLDVEQWVRSAWEMGAKYAVLVANHCTGFSLWPTKANDYSVASMAWKDGKGDIVQDFVDACKKYDIKPGLYYSTGCNGYYGFSETAQLDYMSDEYQAYVKVVEQQLTELWTEYGEMFEVWFDGGIVPHEKGGPRAAEFLEKYQPNAVCFQGPKGHKNNLRWVGTEAGIAPIDCWCTTNAGEAKYNGTVPDEQKGKGTPRGKYFYPAEADTPNRDCYKAFGSGWFWRAGEEHLVYSPETLLDFYIQTVGRNSNLLLGMAISTDGDFPDEDQLIGFGKLLKETFGSPIVHIDGTADSEITIDIPEGKVGKYLVIREDIREGQRIFGFTVSAGDKEILSAGSIGHKRIVPLEGLTGTITLKITDTEEGWSLRDIEIC